MNIGLLSRCGELVREGHEVVVVTPDRFQYYSGMGPGMLGGTYEVDEIRFPVEAIADRAGARFIAGEIERIDAERNELLLAGGDRLPYDVLSLNTGSQTALPFESDTPSHPQSSEEDGPLLVPSKPISGLVELRRRLEETDQRKRWRIVVAGGGPAAVEIAANVAQLLGNRPHEIVMVTGRSLLPGFPRRASRVAARALQSLGITIRTGDRVVGIDATGAVCESGHIPVDLVIAATGVVPSRLMQESGLPTGRDGGLAVGKCLNVANRANIFAGGDCAWFAPRPLPKVGVFAVRETPILIENVMAAMRGRLQMRPFHPQRNYLLLINLGDGRALLWRRFLGFHMALAGRWVWRLKDRIDRSFMSEYGSDREWDQEHSTY